MKNKKINFLVLMATFVMIFGLLVACGSNNFNINGMWSDIDGTTKVFNEDGTCLNVALIDIGGSSPTFSLSESKDSDENYSLYVEQSGYNGTTFYVEVISNDEINIYESSGDSEPLYSLIRQ